MKKLLIILAIVLLGYFGGILFIRSQNQNIFCGGIAGKICSTGFVCQYEDNYPDASGKCVFSLDVFRFLR